MSIRNQRYLNLNQISLRKNLLQVAFGDVIKRQFLQNRRSYDILTGSGNIITNLQVDWIDEKL